MKYYDGLLLRIPNKDNPDVLEEVVKQEKMLDVFKEYLNWSYITGLNNAGDFNIACEEGHATDLINVGEALQEKKIAQIADTIFHRGENGNRVKLVLISGPSSSGKTTFSKRLSIQLMTNGLKTATMITSLFMRSIWNCLISSYRLCCVVKRWNFPALTFLLERKSIKVIN